MSRGVVKFEGGTVLWNRLMRNASYDGKNSHYNQASSIDP
jgi:hypothetical protein